MQVPKISLKDRRKKLRHNLFVNLIESGVVDDKHSNFQEKVYNTRQQKGLYSSSIRTKAYFNSFWPRTKRELRDGT